MGNYKGAEEKERENGDNEDEALSLCDLPNKQENQSKKESPASGGGGGGEEEFDFRSWGGSLKESEMCAADDVFFRGQILPLRHSISSDGAGIRCNSMDRCHSAGYTTASSRSSSTRSHQSSSSAASSITTTPHRKIRNQFQYSQPSPTPQLRFSKIPHANNNYAARNSTLWSLFRVGLVTMPEIGSHSFRARNRDNDNNNNNNRNNLVRSSSINVSNAEDTKPNITQKLKQRFSDKNLVFFDTCKCSSNSIQTIPSPSAKKKNKKNTKQQATTGKQTMSRIRTFEWLKQLSLEAEGAATQPLNN